MAGLEKSTPLSLAHQRVLSSLWEPLRRDHGLHYAEYSFANAFLFRRQHSYVFVDGEFPQVRGRFASGKSFYIPTCLPKDCFGHKGEQAATQETTLFPIPEQWLADFAAFHPSITTERADSDYLFRREKLIHFPGRALSSRRNQLNQFESKHEVVVKNIGPEEMSHAHNILEQWQEHSQQSKEETDYYSCEDGLAHMQQLGLFGRIVYANGLPVGFAIGELLNQTTALLHLLKTLHAYTGVTPFLYRDFAMQTDPAVEWINLEQDLGVAALRRAKEAYEPDMLLPKFRVTLPLSCAGH